jgi:uncharacterized repeat protein (TIGR04138 family)
MQKISIEQAIEQIIKNRPKFHKDAYEFVREALDFTIKQQRKNASGKDRHISGKELLEGVRQYALEQFGPLARTVLSYWNLQSCEDIGEVVYDMVAVSILKTTEFDSPDDFKNGYDFEEAFRRPFEPGNIISKPSQGPSNRSPKLGSSQPT